MRKLILAAITALVAWMCLSEPADAQPGGGPDYPCQYPGVGIGANVLGGYGAFCDFPTEAQGQHWHCETGGFDLGGFAFTQGSVNLGGLSALGGGGTSCTWRCPDNTVAAAPNPPGAWKDALKPTNEACEGHTEPAGPWSETVQPYSQPGPSAPPSGETPAVTNPDAGNPEATENTPHHR
jgi:hypothetical protein